MQSGRKGFQPVIPVGWASSPSIKWDGQSRVLRGMRRQIVFLFTITFDNLYGRACRFCHCEDRQ